MLSTAVVALAIVAASPALSAPVTSPLQAREPFIRLTTPDQRACLQTAKTAAAVDLCFGTTHPQPQIGELSRIGELAARSDMDQTRAIFTGGFPPIPASTRIPIPNFSPLIHGFRVGPGPALPALQTRDLSELVARAEFDLAQLKGLLPHDINDPFEVS